MIENTSFKKYLDELELLMRKQEYLFNFYQDAYEKYKSKVKILSILTLGIYYLRNKYDYEFRCELYEGAIDKIEDNYLAIISDKIYYKNRQNNLNEKLMFFLKNFDQIDKFFTCIKDIPKVEKDKYLSYTMN